MGTKYYFIHQFLDGSSLIDDDIVNMENFPCKLNLKIEDLISSSEEKNGRPPRPLNSFMIFRRNYMAGLVDGPPDKKLSSKITKAWVDMSGEIRDFFEFLSEIACKRHRELYPDYKFDPSKKDKKC